MNGWEIKPNGLNIDAVHRITGETFSGTYAAFNAKMASASVFYKDTLSRNVNVGDLNRVLGSNSSSHIVFTIPQDSAFLKVPAFGDTLLAISVGLGSVSFAAANGVILAGTPISSASSQKISITRTGDNSWTYDTVVTPSWVPVRYLDGVTVLNAAATAGTLTDTQLCAIQLYTYNDGWGGNTHSPEFTFGGATPLVVQDTQDPNYGHPNTGQIQMWDAVYGSIVNKNPSGVTGSTSQFLDNNGAGANILFNAAHVDSSLPAGKQNVWRIRYLAPTPPVTSTNRRCVFRTQGLGLRRTYRVEYSFKFDTGWPVTAGADYDTLIWQIKSAPRTGQYGHPSLSLYVTNDGTNPKLQLAVNAPHHVKADWSKVVGNGYYVRWGSSDYYSQPLDTVALPVGVYHDISMEFFLDERPLAKGGKGYLKIWLGSTLIYDVVGPTAHPEVMSLAEDLSSHTMQFGQYVYNHASGAQDKSLLIQRANCYWRSDAT